MKGLFIVLEGPDGSGKSTMAQHMGKYFESNGREVVYTREPGGTLISEKIRDLILDRNHTEMSYRTEALLYAASRAQLVSELIVPSLELGKVVICERYVYSSLVYQGIGRNLGVEAIADINKFGTGNLEPDLVLFFDIDPQRALQRKLDIDGGDRLENEKLSFHTAVFEGYKSIINDCPNIQIIDASRTIKEIYQDIEPILAEIL